MKVGPRPGFVIVEENADRGLCGKLVTGVLMIYIQCKRSVAKPKCIRKTRTKIVRR